MSEHHIDYHKGWSITVNEAKKMCANFSFEITSPHGITQRVTMGGDSVERALERAKEMIDMERALIDDD